MCPRHGASVLDTIPRAFAIELNAALKINCTFKGRKNMFYLTTHSTHFIYGYMASDIWLRTILIVRKETRCRKIGYSFQLTAKVILYAPSHRQDSTYHGLCYTSRGALAGTRNSSMGSPHEGSIRRPIAPWANALTTELPLCTFKVSLNKYSISISLETLCSALLRKRRHFVNWLIERYFHSRTDTSIIQNVLRWRSTK